MNRIMAAVILASTTALVLNWITIDKLRTERDALRATVLALREGDGSCAVEKKGIRLVCWMEDGAVKVMPLRTGDMIVSRDCLTKKRRATCAR